MLYLNDPLLTSERIITYFENMLKQPEHPNRPTNLRQLKNKLKAIFFAHLDKATSDEDVLKALVTDERFTSNYPKLNQVLNRVFALTDDYDKPNALARLKAIGGTDVITDGAQARFDALNAQYGYFAEASPALHTLFTDLAIACRTMTVLFEKNNDLNDTMPYDYAYKLMALYLDPATLNAKSFDIIAKETHDLVTKIDTDKGHPFHEALLVKLQLPAANDLTDKAGWRGFIKAEGAKSFYYFAMAKKIEEKIAETSELQSVSEPRRAPKNLKEANAMDMLCTYSRGKEDVAFAEVCHQYKVPEYRFNSCLDYMASTWPKKTADSIPDIQIKGEGEAEGFYWLKMPVTDKRALILGDITDCCQSIAGDSEQCVKDAVSMGDNGLYVLVKQRKKGNPALITNGAINDRDFKIIGQAYTWKSKSGNICLDSIECLNNGITNLALKSILSAFATKLLQENPTIKFVTMGRGGKTPYGLFDDAPICEKIRQGYQYGDSATQYCIAKTPHSLSQTQRDSLLLLLQDYPQEFKDCMDYLSYYLPAQDIEQRLENLLRDNPSFSTDLGPLSLERLFSLTQSPAIYDLEPVNFDDLDKIAPDNRDATLKNISTARLFWRDSSWTPDYFSRAIQYVPEEERFDLVMMKDDSQKSILHSALRKPESLAVIMNSLPQDQRLEVVMEKDRDGRTILHDAAYNQECLAAILNSLPEGLRLDAVKGKSGFSLSVLHCAATDLQCLTTILNLYPENERLDAVKKEDVQGETVLHYAACNPKCLALILNLYPEHERLDAVKKKGSYGLTVLQTAARNAEYLPVILSLYPEDQRLEAVKEKDALARSILHYAGLNHEVAVLTAILNSLPENQRLDALKDPDGKGRGALQSAASNAELLDAMFNSLPEHQRVEAAADKDNNGWSTMHLASRNKGCAEVIVNSVPEAWRLAVMVEKYQGAMKLRLPEENGTAFLTGILTGLSAEQRLAAVMEPGITGITALHCVAGSSQTLLSIILNSLSEEQRLAAVMEIADGATVLGHAVYSREPDCVTEIMNSLTEDQRFALVMKKNDEDGWTELHFAASKRPYSDGLFAILNCLPNNKRLEAVMAKDNKGQSVLMVAAKNPDTLTGILETLTEDERFDVVQGNVELFASPKLLPELKKIVLEKIKSADNNAVFDGVKQQITNATAFPEVKEHLQELGRLLILHSATEKENIASSKEYRSKIGELRPEAEQTQTPGFEK